MTQLNRADQVAAEYPFPWSICLTTHVCVHTHSFFLTLCKKRGMLANAIGVYKLQFN